MLKRFDPDAKTILAVENDDANAQSYELLIATETPYNLWLMKDDIETLARIEEIKTVKPVLFLLDYLLSSMTGLDLYDQLHKEEALRDIPALITTASNPRPLEEELTKRGLTIIEKPFEIDTFLQIINHALDIPLSS